MIISPAFTQNPILMTLPAFPNRSLRSKEISTLHPVSRRIAGRPARKPSQPGMLEHALSLFITA